MLLIHLNNDLVSQYKLFLDTIASQDWGYVSKRVAKIDLVIVPSVTKNVIASTRSLVLYW